VLGGGFLKNFFLAGSFGYLQESEDEMWHAQLGIDLQPQLAGLDQAVFLELGYNKLEFFNLEQEIFPLTLNYKLERSLFGPVNIYAGVGGGIAFFDISGGVNADDEVFWGQIFGGLVYNVSEKLEIVAGLRGVFLDEVNINGFTSSTGDDLLWELGARYNF
jgi:opacity protein-like surface antigen